MRRASLTALRCIHLIAPPHSTCFAPCTLLSSFSSHTFSRNVPEQSSPPAPETNSKFVALNPRTVNRVLSSCPSDLIALSFFLWCARQPNYFHDPHTFDRIAVVVGRLTEKFETVASILQGLKSVGCTPKPQTFLLLLRIFWRGQMYELLCDTFETMNSFGYMPNTFAHNILMDALFKTGCEDAAFKVFRGIPAPNFLTFNILLCHLCKLNYLDNIRNALRLMLRKGYHPDAGTFLMVLNVFCKMRRVREAFQILGLMVALGIPFSVHVWSVIIDLLCKCGGHEAACHLLLKMVEAGCSPNVVTYTSLIKGLLESQCYDYLSDVLGIMESEECAPDVVLCNVLIDSLSKSGRKDDALKLFCRMFKQELTPDSYTFSSLSSAICSSRRPSFLLKVMRGSPIQDDLVVCNILLCNFCKSGFPTDAVKFYKSMLDRGLIPDRFTFSCLLCALCGAGRIDEAVDVYSGILMSHSGIDAHIHTIIIGELIKVGRYHRAIRLFRKAVAEKYPLDVVSYTVALHGLFQGARIAEAGNLFAQMKEAGIVPNMNTYNVMLCGSCKERDTKMIEWILKEMIDSRTKMQSNALRRLSNLHLRTRFDSVSYLLLSDMWTLGLLPEEAKHVLLFDGLQDHAKMAYS